MKNQKKSYVPIELLLMGVPEFDVCSTSYEVSTEKLDEVSGVTW